MVSKRNAGILLSVVGVGAVVVPLLVYNYTQLQERNTNPWNVFIFGSGTTGNVTISYDELRSGKYQILHEGKFDILNRLDYSYTYSYTGVVLWDLLEQSGVVAPNATEFRFWAEDNYRCEPLPLSLAESYPTEVILAWEEDNKILKPRRKGGDGPLRSVVNLTISQLLDPPTYNSQFWVKYTNAIEIIS